VEAEVLSLLAQGSPAADCFEAPLFAASQDDGELATEFEGQELGPYRLGELLGRGGMGAVYRARRSDGSFDHEVAIKLIKRGMDTDAVVARFLAERQILAGLAHPGIAHLFDGGSTPSGQPYLVMELVDGVPIDRYCEQRQLSLDERLGLFLDVCGAVHYAHQHLVVHRDIKPRNVLVRRDGSPVLLDFGIAKLLDSAAAGEETSTRLAERPFTPGYASPEQLAGAPTTTAADVYSLGALLYRLLTGVPPYEPAGSTASALLDRIRGSNPQPPSAVLAGSRPELAAGRPPVPSGRVRGDLDNIVLCALNREPERRYPSAAALASDIDHFLAGLPVAASPDSKRYRARKFLLRNWRWALPTAAAVLVAALGAGSVGWLYLEARAQRDQARQQRARADEEAEAAREVTGFLVDLLAAVDPLSAAPRPDATVRQVLAVAAGRIRDRLEGQPRVRGRLLHEIGSIERRLGMFDEALAVLTEAVEVREKLDGQPLELADSLYSLGVLASDLGRYAEARPLLERSLEIRRGELGEGHPVTARSWTGLGILAKLEGDYVASEALLRRVLEVRRSSQGPRHPDVAFGLVNLGDLLRLQGRNLEAAPMFEESLSIIEEKLGPKHPSFGPNLNQLAGVYAVLGKLDLSEAAFKRALSLEIEALGPGHQEVGFVYNNLAEIQMARGDYTQAEENLLTSRAILEAALGRVHPLVGESLSNLGELEIRAGRHRRASADLTRAVEILEARIPGHPSTGLAYGRLGRALAAQGRSTRAASVFARARSKLEAVAEQDPKNRQARRWLAAVLVHESELLDRNGDEASARELGRRAQALATSLLTEPPEPEVVETLALALVGIGRAAEAETLAQRLQATGWVSRDLDHALTAARSTVD
jgi:serine/threonine-protein kinase